MHALFPGLLRSILLRWKLRFSDFLHLYDSKLQMIIKSLCMRFGRQNWSCIHFFSTKVTVLRYGDWHKSGPQPSSVLHSDCLANFWSCWPIRPKSPQMFGYGAAGVLAAQSPSSWAYPFLGRWTCIIFSIISSNVHVTTCQSFRQNL